MVNASKILTVSYGTFSCTLEGFDDPVGAMQTVAEYFRDLAADDPHFGAEPPKLDQVALSQIAERQTQKRVDATVEKDNLVIRQIDAPPTESLPNAAPTEDASADLAPASEAPAPSSMQDTTATQQETAEPGRASTLATAGVAAAVGVAGTAAAAGVAESVSEKLARIRAAVRRSREEPEPLLNQMFSEDEGAETVAEPEVPFEPISALDEAEPLSFDEQDDVDAQVDTESEELDLTGLIETAVGEADADEAETGLEDTGEDAGPNAPADPIDTAPVAAEEAQEPEAASAAETETPAEQEPETAAEVAEGIAEAADIGAEFDIDADVDAPLIDQATAEAEAFMAEPDSAEPVEETEATTEDTLAAVLAETANIADPSDVDAFEEDFEEDQETADGEADEIDLSAVLQQAELDAPAADEAAPSEPEPPLAADLPEALDLSAILDSAPETVPVSEPAPESEPEPAPETEPATAQDSEPEVGEALANYLAAQEPPAEDTPAEETSAEQTAATPRVRVLKMSRDEFEKQFEEAPDDDAEEALPEATAESATASVEPGDIRETLGETGLSEEDEEDLIRELMAATQDDAAPDEAGQAVGDAQPTVDAAPEDAPLVLTAPITPEPQPTPLETFDRAEAPDPATPLSEDSPEDVHKALEKLVEEASKVSPGAEKLNISPEDDGASVDRLLAEADSAMEDNEGNRRRSAIAHLKAAVAAVRADGDRERDAAEAETARTMDRFRQDLARAVRPGTQTSAQPDAQPDVQPSAAASPVEEPAQPEPRDAGETARVTPRRPAAAAPGPRPDAGAATADANGPTPESNANDGATARPRRAMAPLMLVSEQRVDKTEDDTAQAEPVRPRRIQTEPGADVAAPAADSNADEFKAFLVKTRADGLQEELEASLAYGIFVEGAEHNARPRIMGRVLRQYPDGSVTREDGLRAFGVLLREGRINRIRRGEFTLPETSRFHPKNNTQADTA